MVDSGPNSIDTEQHWFTRQNRSRQFTNVDSHFHMLTTAYYEADLHVFCNTSDNEILGELTAKHHFSLENQQRYAWQEQIRILKSVLSGKDVGKVFFEFRIPRM